MAELPELLTVQEAAKVLKCSPRSVYRYIGAGLLSAKKGPGQTLIPAGSITTFIESLDDAG